MRVRALLIIAATVVVAGCQAGPSTAAGPSTTTTTTTKKPPRTTTPPPRTTPKPDADTPHQTVRFRLAIVDPDHNSVLIPDTANPNPARDPKSAKQIRQDPALATDKAAQQRAAASLDCAHADPLAGMDDPKLPLATCGSTEFMELFGPVLLDRTMVVGASYGPGGPVPGRWDVSVELSAAGREVAAELAPKNVNVLLGMFFDGQLAGATPVPEKSTGTLEFSFDKEDDARQVATVINNR